MKPMCALITVAAVVFGGGSALAMTTLPGSPRPCRVQGGEKLPASAGSTDALCDAIERAVAAAAPETRYTVDVRVGPSSLRAVIGTADGRTLPEQRLVVNDRGLTKGSINRFARAIAARLADVAP